MATTTNYGWTTPDDTGLVKDGASAIRSLGTSVDTTTKNLNPSTTLGDIEYRSSTANTNTRLGIGSTGQVLTVAGGVPSWATPGGSNANFSLLNTGGTALSGTTTTVSGISGMNKLFISIEYASTNTSNSSLTVRFNTDSGANYLRTTNQIELTGTYDPDFWSASVGRGTNGIIVGQMDNDATSLISSQLKVDGCNSAGLKIYQYTGGATSISKTTGSGPVWYFGGGAYFGTSTISSVSFVSANTFDSGTVYIYGSAV